MTQPEDIIQSEGSNITQQTGPSPHPDSVILSRAEYEEMRRELKQLKGPRGQASAFFSQVTTATSVTDLKIMARVEAMPCPEGMAWGVDKETRSMKRFLSDVGRTARLAALDERATFLYLTTKCLTPMVAKEVMAVCGDILDAAESLCEAERYLNETFRRSNSTAGFIARFEGSGWCETARNIREYHQLFGFMLREAELLGVVLDEEQGRRFFLKGLPDLMKTLVMDMMDFEEMSVSALVNKLEGWSERTGKNPFGTKSKQVNAVSEERIRSGGPPMRGPAGCWFCGSPDHLKRNCGKFQEWKRSNDTKHIPTEPNKTEELKWTNVIQQASALVATASLRRAHAEVKFSRVDNHEISKKFTVLIDTGADVSMMTQAAAEKLREAGIVDQSHVRMGGPQLRAADDSEIVTSGYLTVCVQGRKCECVVVPKLCTEFLIGMDLLSKVDELIPKLVQSIKGCSYADAERICAGVMFGPSKLIADEEVKQELGTKQPESYHCSANPVCLPWRIGAREALRGKANNARAARAEADRLEGRLKLKKPETYQAYSDILEQWQAKGWIEEIPFEQVGFCLRHFPVAKESVGIEKSDQEKRTLMQRCRVVVDGSSLREFFDIPGDIEYDDLWANLLCWRTADRFALFDVSQAFMRVEIDPADRPFLTICWKKKFLQFCSLPMGISPSPWLLKSTLEGLVPGWESGIKEKHPEAQMTTKAYVDDLMALLWRKAHSDGAGDLLAVEGEVVECLERHLCEVGMPISKEKLKRTGDSGTVLGVPFTARDTIKVKFHVSKSTVEQLSSSIMTRRIATRYLSKLFDPLGIALEMATCARLLMKKLSGLAWDGALPPALQREVLQWVTRAHEEAINLEEPRKLSPGRTPGGEKDRVFIFCDASNLSYAASLYAIDEDGRWKRMTGVSATYKRHQTPWITTSSKIELLAMRAGTELMLKVKKALVGIDRWANAQFVLGIDNETNLQRMVSDATVILDKWERGTTVEIRNLLAKNGCLVYHVPGTSNPTDLASRARVGEHSTLAAEAIRWFQEDRAVTPTKTRLSRVVSEERPGGEVAAAARLRAESPEELQRAQPRISLNERYLTETRGEKDRSLWLREYQLGDMDISKCIASDQATLQNGVWVMKRRFRQDLDGQLLEPVLMPRSLVTNCLTSLHDCSGHHGYRKVLMRARDEFYWKGMTADTKRHCLTCVSCQQLKGGPTWKTGPGVIHMQPRAWTLVGIDTCRKLGPGNEAVLTITCLYTRYVYSYPIEKETGKEVAAALQTTFCLEGPPTMIVSDNHSSLLSKEVQQILKAHGVDYKSIPRGAPWYGTYEIVHKGLTRTLASVIHEVKEKIDFPTALKLATFYFNSRPLELTDQVVISPLECFRGRKANVLWNRSSEDGIEDVYPTDGEVFDAVIRADADRTYIMEVFEETWKRMREKSMREISRRVRTHVEYQVGDFVWIWIPRERRDKTDLCWAGPFRISAKESPVLYRIGNKLEHIKNLKKYLKETDPHLVETEELGDIRIESEARHLPPEDPSRAEDPVTQMNHSVPMDQVDKGSKRKTSESDDREQYDFGNPAEQLRRSKRTRKYRVQAVLAQEPRGDLLLI